MEEFFELEIGHIVIALFFLVAIAIVTTRSFISKGVFKKGIFINPEFHRGFYSARYAVDLI